jgi:hypothetical protein
VKKVPTLRHLLEELRKLDVDPGEIRIPAALYDDLLDEAEQIAEKNPTSDTEDEDSTV